MIRTVQIDIFGYMGAHASKIITNPSVNLVWFRCMSKYLSLKDTSQCILTFNTFSFFFRFLFLFFIFIFIIFSIFFTFSKSCSIFSDFGQFFDKSINSSFTNTPLSSEKVNSVFSHNIIITISSRNKNTSLDTSVCITNDFTTSEYSCGKCSKSSSDFFIIKSSLFRMSSLTLFSSSENRQTSLGISDSWWFSDIFIRESIRVIKIFLWYRNAHSIDIWTIKRSFNFFTIISHLSSEINRSLSFMAISLDSIS